MKKYLSIVLYTIISVFILTGLVFVIFLILNSGPTMKFPRKLAGSFIEQPNIVEVEGKKLVQWTVPVYCTRNGYEVQNVGYRSGGDGYWGGRDDAKCVPGNGGYQCRGELLEEMLNKNGEWMIQASNHGCSSDAYFMSELIMVTVD